MRTIESVRLHNFMWARKQSANINVARITHSRSASVKNMETSGKQQIRLIWCELIYVYVYPTAPLTFYNFDASELLCVGIGAVEKNNLCENSQMIQQKSFDLPNKKTDQIYRCCYFNNFRCSCVCRLFPQYLQNAGFCECWISAYLWYWFGVRILTSNVFVNM